MDTVVRSRRVVLPGGERPAAVHVEGGRIAAIGGYEDVPPHAEEHDLGDLVLLPGLVDTHVHVNEPGRTEWEGFDSATRAAAAGGVTTVCDMPLNSVPPTTSATNLEVKRAAAEGAVHVDVAFWGGATPDSLAHLGDLAGEGVVGVKGFLVDSGVPEFRCLDAGTLDATARRCAELDLLLAVHAEDPGCVHQCQGGGSYRSWLASRPPEAESVAVHRLAAAVSTYGTRAHVVHVSAADALAELGEGMTAETCPHYLVLRAEDVADGDTAAKCAPPVRDEANRDELWQALGDGRISLVVSDHSPAPPELKDTGDFATAWGGIASVQLGLPLVWTEARTRGHDLGDVARWMSTGPAALAGLDGKGAIAIGNDADLVAFDPDAELVVDPEALHHRHPVSPYTGRRLTGVVRTTWLRGTVVDGAPRGTLLRRGRRAETA